MSHGVCALSQMGIPYETPVYLLFIQEPTSLLSGGTDVPDVSWSPVSPLLRGIFGYQEFEPANDAKDALRHFENATSCVLEALLDLAKGQLLRLNQKRVAAIFIRQDVVELPEIEDRATELGRIRLEIEAEASKYSDDPVRSHAVFWSQFESRIRGKRLVYRPEWIKTGSLLKQMRNASVGVLPDYIAVHDLQVQLVNQGLRPPLRFLHSDAREANRLLLPIYEKRIAALKAALENE